MFKLANQIIDAYDDINRVHLKKLAQINPNIEFMDPEDRTQLEDQDFALSIITKKASKLNKFPVNNHDSTWLSNQYFQESYLRLPKTAAEIAAYHIKKACERYRVDQTPAVSGMAKEASSNVYFEQDIPQSAKVNRVITPDLSKFAEVQKIGDNYTFAQYTFATPPHVKMASKYFDEVCDDIPLEYRHKYAAAIQKRAKELGMEKQEGKVVKYASDHYSGFIDAHLASRKSLLEVADPKFVAALNKMASMKKDIAPIEFAKVLHGFDKRAGLSKYYGGYLTDPYLSTFANEPDPYIGWRTKVAGVELDSDAIKKVATEKYAQIKQYFGKDVADEFKKEGVSIYESFPQDVKEVIASMANGEI